MNQGELRFVEALLIYCLLADSPPISAEEQAEIDARDLTVAREGRRPGLHIVDGGRERPLRERGLELLAGVRDVAELLDADAQGYVAAVDAAAEALRDPDGLRPRRLLAALATEQATFFRVHAGARAHPRGLLSRFRPGAAREQALAETARRSLEEAEALAAKDSRSFADYLRDYFARPRRPSNRRRPFFVIPLTAAGASAPGY